MEPVFDVLAKRIRKIYVSKAKLALSQYFIHKVQWLGAMTWSYDFNLPINLDGFDFDPRLRVWKFTSTHK